MDDHCKSGFGPEYLLVFTGYTGDASEAAEVLVGLEQLLQKEIDKLRSVNPDVRFSRIKMWKWDSDAQPIRGGQSANITPFLERANIAVFVFNERIGDVAWQELNYAIRKDPPIAVLPFFKSTPPEGEKMLDKVVAKEWADLVEKASALTAGWTDPGTNAIMPLPKYNSLAQLSKLASERLTTEVVRLASQYATRVKKTTPRNPFDEKISKMGHFIHKIKAKDTSGKWAYYFVLVMPENEKKFLRALNSNGSLNLENYGSIVASCYGEKPTQEVKDYLKEKYGFDV